MVTKTVLPQELVDAAAADMPLIFADRDSDISYPALVSAVRKRGHVRAAVTAAIDSLIDREILTKETRTYFAGVTQLGKSPAPNREVIMLKATANLWSLLKPARKKTTGGGGAGDEASKPKGTVNHRMLEHMQANPESMGWSSGDWARHLKCTTSTVCGTKAWKTLARASKLAE